MNRTASAGALLCALSLGACQTSGTAALTPAGTPIVIPTAQLPAVVAQAQSKVVQACAFLPTAQTIIGIAKSFSSAEIAGGLATADTIAAGICAAANGGHYASLRSARGDNARGTYRGVRIRGRDVITR